MDGVEGSQGFCALWQDLCVWDDWGEPKMEVLLKTFPARITQGSE